MRHNLNNQDSNFCIVYLFRLLCCKREDCYFLGSLAYSGTINEARTNKQCKQACVETLEIDRNIVKLPLGPTHSISLSQSGIGAYYPSGPVQVASSLYSRKIEEFFHQTFEDLVPEGAQHLVLRTSFSFFLLLFYLCNISN